MSKLIFLTLALLNNQSIKLVSLEYYVMLQSVLLTYFLSIDIHKHSLFLQYTKIFSVIICSMNKIMCYQLGLQHSQLISMQSNYYGGMQIINLIQLFLVQYILNHLLYHTIMELRQGAHKVNRIIEKKSFTLIRFFIFPGLRSHYDQYNQ